MRKEVVSRATREKEVMGWLMEGVHPRNIALITGLSYTTIKIALVRLHAHYDMPKGGGKYLPTVRMVYLESKAQGLLPGWPE